MASKAFMKFRIWRRSPLEQWLRISVLLPLVLFFSFCHLSMGHCAFDAVEPIANDSHPGSHAPRMTPDDSEAGNILEAVVQWGGDMLNRFVFRKGDGKDTLAEAETTMTDACKTVVDFLGCDYEFYQYDDNADKIINRYFTLAEQGKTAGFYPLIIIQSDSLAEMLRWALVLEDVENTAEGIAAYRQKIIGVAEELDAASFLSIRLDQYMEMFQGFDLLGEFVPFTPDDRLLSFMLLYRSHQEVVIAKIPAEKPWELAAWIPMGGFNTCPMPAEQVAVFRHWYEMYGAVPVTVTHDIWEMALTKPPATDAEAEALAKEQFAFCEDSVFQGTQTIRGLASILKNAATWFFWWD